MSRAHAAGRTFFSFPDAMPWEPRDLWLVFPVLTAYPVYYPARDIVYVALDMPRERGIDLIRLVRPSYVPPERVGRALATLIEAIAIDRPRRHAVRGDYESQVSDGTIKELVALAKADNRIDFDFLAGACGVEDREALWNGTRARVARQITKEIA